MISIFKLNRFFIILICFKLLLEFAVGHELEFENLFGLSNILFFPSSMAKHYTWIIGQTIRKCKQLVNYTSTYIL